MASVTGEQQRTSAGNEADDVVTLAPETLDQQAMVESPLPPTKDGFDQMGVAMEGPGREELLRPSSISHHVSSSNETEEVHIILHGATNLPATNQSRPPKAFAIVKTKSDEDRNLNAELVTTFNPNPSFSTTWESFGVVTVDERRSSEEVLIFKIIDAPTKQVLAKYHLPLNYLQPFHPYHLEMVMPSVSSSQGVMLIASITRKLSVIPKNDISPNYLGIEVLLQSVNEEFEQPVGPITAVAKIISSFYPYRDDVFSSHYLDWSHLFGASAKTVHFPNPHKSLFLPPASHTIGLPQVTLPGEPETKPEWNHCFIFIDDRDSATLFNPHCALLIEFYRTKAAMTNLTWRLTNPLGYCIIPLDHDMYRSLSPSLTKDTNAGRIVALPIQKCLLETVDKKSATVNLVLRLVNSQRPGSLKDLNELEGLPVITVNQQLMNSKMDFPPHDAMEEILEPKRLTNRKKFAEKPEDELGNLDSTDILDFQLKELNAYRDAIRRMEKEMESLHEQMRTLHTTNAKLRRQLGTAATTSARTPPGASSSARGFPGAENEMVPVGGGGGELKKRFRKENDFPTADDARLWDKTEMEDRHDLMMKKVDRQARELKEYREKVLKLQNELIQKNEKEKDFLRHSVSSLDNSSKDLEKQVQTRTAKIRGLEEAYRNQEKIIDKMEKLLETRHKGDKDLQEVRNKIIEENKRLRAENQMLTEQNRLMAKSKKEEEEMLHLRQRMDRDAERIRTLEQKLVDNARRWAHEKTDLQTRLEEAEHGFRRTSVLDSASRSFAQPNWSTGADDDRPSPTIDTKFKLNRSSNRLPSIHA